MALHDPARHEALQPLAWDEGLARDAIDRIVADTEADFDAARGGWPRHPNDADPGADLQQPVPPLYHGTLGVCWALHDLHERGAVARLRRSYRGCADALVRQTRAWLGAEADAERASYLMGETPIALWAWGGESPDAQWAERLHALVDGNDDHPARELMWGAPGTMLAALFAHERSGDGDADGRWAALFRRQAARLWQQLEWSDEFGCRYWTQDLYGRRSTYIDAVHGFVATASPLIRGRRLLSTGDRARWEQCIAETVAATATLEDGRVNWRPWLTPPSGPARPLLMQYCHGAPGFVVCLAEFPPSPEMDGLLVAAGEAVWAAGPLLKGNNLCHGTGGNGYAFLALHRRTGDPLWLERARAFAMHGIRQGEADLARFGRRRHSLWTGDVGFAVYLWDCISGRGGFPTVDRFFPEAAARG